MHVLVLVVVVLPFLLCFVFRGVCVYVPFVSSACACARFMLEGRPTSKNLRGMHFGPDWDAVKGNPKSCSNVFLGAQFRTPAIFF